MKNDMKNDSNSPSKTMCVVLFLVSQGIGILRLLKRIFIDTCALLRCYYTFVLPILSYFSPVLGSAAECHLLVLERQVYSVARLCPDQGFLLLCRRRHVAGLGMLYNLNSNSNLYLFNKLPPASTIARYTRAAAATHPLEFEVSSVERLNLKGVSCRPRFECGMTFPIHSI